MKKLSFAALAGVLALSMAACGDSASSGDAEDYPAGDITMVVAYAAGGPTDLAGRAVAKQFEKDLGVSVVVENLEGASGAVGSAKVINSKPDGLTLGTTTASAISRVPTIEKVGFEAGDGTPIGVVTESPGIFFVNEDSPYQTFEDLLADAKKRPGKITVGAAGAQTPQAVELLRMGTEYDTEFKLVPFQGDAPALTGLLGDNVDVIIPSYNEQVRAQHEAGKIRPLAVMGPERKEYLGDVPTLAESGFDELTYGISSFIVIAPKDTPEEIVTKLEDSLEAALEDPATRKAAGELNIPAEFIGSEELQQKIDDEVETLTPILKQLFG
ncbi:MULTISPECIES: Bug family tripartite tricarboxylate transporter substrate binding protein [unclassified Aeromicrobium]|uniref:Bug family tripartite tricarboxylate transporter substrate binding protein n=1 Tax=unclassified Aeromicrobium TaxID=2633570 RepID=UPI00396B3A54